jgi:hypothetical protein
VPTLTPTADPYTLPIDIETWDAGAAFLLAANMLDPKPSPGTALLDSFFDDPVGWVHEFAPSFQLTPYQEEILRKLPEALRACVRGPHGLGKTGMAAIVVLWFTSTREARCSITGQDWKVVTTASVWRQLTKYLWPEIHKWAKRVLWVKMGWPVLGPRTGLIKLTLKLKYGQAFAAASDVPENIEGAHADFILYLVDEGKTVIPGSYDAIEGALTTVTAMALVISTPGKPEGRFYEIQVRRPGFEDWWVRHVRLDEAIAAGRIPEGWVEQRKKQWGENSAIYKNRVLGEFAADDVDGLIPNAWVEAAQLRWTPTKPRLKTGEPAPLSCVGIDVARFGHDNTTFAKRYRFWWDELDLVHGADTMEVTGKAVEILRNAGMTAHACVDVIGIGAGVVDRLREQQFDVEPFNASNHSDETDITGELTFVNRRASAWWMLRDALNPVNNYNIALPPDDELLGDLCSPHYKRMSGGKIQIEGKDEIKKRLGRSPDKGDAVVMSLANRIENYEGVVVWDDPVEIAPY